MNVPAHRGPDADERLGADEDSRAFWEGLRAHRLVLQGCATCGRRRFPPMPACPYCGAPGGAAAEASGRGRVYSWVRVHRAFAPELADEVPYTVVTVTLEEGCRAVGRLEPDGAAADGLAVAARYVDHEGWTELRFAPTAGEEGS